ncbi:MAG: carboxy terminal-processing peptidase [Gammaproteobacteria bacterium]|nr:carboxy terminal-processing peptidase [Gammaproteobacteria bacterium]
MKPAKFEPAAAPIDKFRLARQHHKERIEHDDRFKTLLKRTKFLDEARQDKSVSLNIDTRREERDRLLAEQEQLDEEYRDALGLNIEEHDGENEDAAAENDNEDRPDILLREAARILNDLIVPPEEMPRRLHADRQSASVEPSM